MTTTTNTARILVDTSQARASLAGLHAGLDKTTSMFGRMKTMMLGIGFGAFAKSAINAAGELKDLAESTGFLVDSLARLKVALNVSGGNADKLPQLVSTFSKKLDEAAQGSLKAQNQFRELGISLSDLENLNTEQNLLKTLQGLDGLGAGARRTALQLDMFGKNAMTLSSGDLAKAWSESAEEGKKYADSIKKAGELNDKLAQATDNLKLAFIKAFEPAIDLINKFAESTKEGTTQLDKMVVGVKIIGSVLASVFSVGIFLGFVKTLGTVGRGFAAISGALGAASVSTWAASAFRAMGPLLTSLRAVAVIFSAGLGIYTATQLFEDFGDVATNALARVVEGVGQLTGALAGASFGAGVGSAFGPLGTIVGGFLGGAAGLAGMTLLTDKAKQAREEAEKIVKLQKDAVAAAKPKTSTDPVLSKTKVDTSEYDKAINAAKQLGGEYLKNNEKVKNQITLDTVLLGKGAEEADLIKAKAALYEREYEEVEKLQKAKENLSAEEKKAGVGAEYDKQIAQIKEMTDGEERTLEWLIKQQQAKQRLIDLNKFQLEQTIANQDKLRQITSDTAQLTMGSLQRSYKEIEDAAENTYQSKLAEAKLNKQTLSNEDIAAIKKSAYEGVEAQKAARKEYYDASRTFSTGWKQAFNEYVENATDAASEAKRVFEVATKGMEDAIINFAKTGKFEFKSFMSSIVEELLRADIRKAMAGIFSGSSGGTGSGVFSSIGKFFGGFAGGGMIPAGGFGIVGESGPEFISGPAQITPMRSTNVTYNINAVDARSFQQLVAADPAFIHAVASKGQRSLGGAR